MYFWTSGLRKLWLDKCIKSPLSDYPWTCNMVNGTKHCWNLNDSTFTIFIDPCENNSGWKSLSECYWKSYDCLLTHWLPITSILFLIENIYNNILRCSYLTDEKYFPKFFLHFVNLDSILNIFKNTMTLIADVLFEFTDSQTRGYTNVKNVPFQRILE